MEFNSLLFPAPEPSYSRQEFELLWVPNVQDTKIPCLLLQCPQGSSKVLMYFHGNAQDLGIAYQMLDTLRSYLQVHVLGVQYPGYGAYSGNPSANQIIQDSVCVFDFLQNSLGVNPSNIMVFGRSIGSGPAAYLARYKNPAALFLMSAYTSIKAAVRTIAGRLAQMLVAERFVNIENIQYVVCPTFILHGKLDTLIPYSHSEELRDSCAGPVQLHMPDQMDHNFFEYYEDLLIPIMNFVDNFGLEFQPQEGDEGFLKVQPEMCVAPQVPETRTLGVMNFLMRKLNK